MNHEVPHREVHRWRELVADDATYWFTDGSFEGVEAIAAAVQRTFDEIVDEVCTISDLHWVCTTPDCAVVRYQFHWAGDDGVVGRKRKPDRHETLADLVGEVVVGADLQALVDVCGLY
ncbi:nuclear transport factor 2 family protein [Streptomyces sp. SID13031]|uniref:nuclear transport factor 2 family protein n=1 Tax=Streptomyces sp. SID13031 TaxID=2706046 RepID=UPI0013C98DCE|nr:nuclear transport factor 2 family protein [Streptomyces sp. SID13031]